MHCHDPDPRRQKPSLGWGLTETLIHACEDLGLLLMVLRAEVVAEFLKSYALRELENLV
jgi:hypothetical protein